MQIVLERYAYLPGCTLGVLTAGDITFYTIECPWLNNAPFKSCIPEGVYRLSPYSSARFRDVYKVENVVGRTHILLHAGNTVDDVQGCIAVGSGRQLRSGDFRVTQSRLAMVRLRAQLGRDLGSITVTAKRAKR